MGDNKSKKQVSKIENVAKFYKLRDEVIRFHKDYFKIVHKVGCDSKYGESVTLLTLKQMLQRLSIAIV